MKKKLIYLFVSLFTFMSCSDGAFDDGHIDLSKGYVEEEEDTYKVYSLNHPCLLHTNADFTYVRKKIDEGAEPWISAWNYLNDPKKCPYTQLNNDYLGKAVEILFRGPNGGNYTSARHPGLAAYYLALRWKLSEGKDPEAYKYADKAVKILNEWATTCKGIDQTAESHDHYALVSGFDGYRFTQSAEILRDYEGWAREDFEAYKQWMIDVFYTPASYFMSFKTDPYWSWGGWETPNLATILSIGILCDNQDMINYAINFFKHGPSSGCISNLVVALHQDPLGLGEGYCLGQADESGRDQPHAGLNIVTVSALCQSAYNIGEDLFAIKANDTFKDKEGVEHYRYDKYAEYGDTCLLYTSDAADEL